MRIFKYVFSPWTDKFIKRKLSMKDYMSESDIRRGLGIHHHVDRKQLFKAYEKALLEDNKYHE
jgi:hypothetical protein